MVHDGSTAEHDDASTPGASPAAPNGTTAIALYSDLRCPWAHVAVHRLLQTVEARGVGSELAVDHRWFQLSSDAMPTTGTDVDQKLEPFRLLEPDAGWYRWSEGDEEFPQSSRLPAAWVQGAKRVSPTASVALDRALRVALFAEGRDISDEAVVAEVAAAVPEVAADLDVVRSEVASGRPDDELDRQAELSASDLVAASPTLVLTDGTTWTNPGIDFHADEGVPVIDDDHRDVYGDIVDAFLALRHYD